MDIRELLRHLCADLSNRSVARTLGIDRRTVGQYRQWATEQGLLEDQLPAIEGLQALAASTFNTVLPPQYVSTVEPYREQIVAWRREMVWHTTDRKLAYSLPGLSHGLRALAHSRHLLSRWRAFRGDFAGLALMGLES